MVSATSRNGMQGELLAYTHSDWSPFRKVDGDTMRSSAIAPAGKVAIEHVSVSSLLHLSSKPSHSLPQSL